MKVERKVFYPGNGMKPYRKFVAEVGGYTVSGDTRKDVAERMEEEINRVMNNSYTRMYIPCPSGSIVVFYYTPSGWSYDIVREGRNTCTTILKGSMDEAFRMAKSHAGSL